MDILKVALLTIQITTVLPKRYISSSDESIENLLYFKDCKHNPKPNTDAPVALRGPPPPTPPTQPSCPFPKMCCALSCGNECPNSQPFGRQSEPIQPIQPIQPAIMNAPPPPIQPFNQRGRKKRMKVPIMPAQPPSRRDFGFTKDKIKNLISQDGDIRKILKDLVRVTMQKADLMEKLNIEQTTVKYEQGSASEDELE